MKIVTFNLRHVYDGDGINSLAHRAFLIYDKIKEEKPDVVAFQEMREKPLEVFEQLFGNEYIFAGQLREENYSDEGLYTMIRKESMQLLGLETIWLSPTPYVVASRFENQSEYSRICTQTLVRHKESGQVMNIFNIHLDHISEEARVLGINCAFDFIEEHTKKRSCPLVLLGDFNALPDSETISLCKERFTDVTGKIETTFHDFGRTASKIDYIFMSDELRNDVKDVKIWDNCENGIYLSDHYPIEVTL